MPDNSFKEIRLCSRHLYSNKTVAILIRTANSSLTTLQQQGPAHSLSACSNGEPDTGVHLRWYHLPHVLHSIIGSSLCGSWHMQYSLGFFTCNTVRMSLWRETHGKGSCTSFRLNLNWWKLSISRFSSYTNPVGSLRRQHDTAAATA